MSGWVRALRNSAVFGIAAALAQPLGAASYLPISDSDLVKRSPVIVRAHVESVATRLEIIMGRQVPMTVVNLQPIEILRGQLSGLNLQLILPGGRVGDRISWVPGTPSLQAGQEAILFLRPVTDRNGDFFLSEFGLSHFDIRSDAAGRSFAVRPVFSPEEDSYVSQRVASIQPGASSSLELRDTHSFIEFITATSRGLRAAKIEYARPDGMMSESAGRIRPLWVNNGGPEPGNSCGPTNPNCLFRWFTDTGASPAGVVTISGTQSNLSDGSNGTPAVQNAVTQWTAVPSSTVPYSGPAATGNVSVQLDAPQDFFNGAVFKTPLPCGSGGVLGLGGTLDASGPVPNGYTFKGDANYFAMQTGNVSMRQLTGPAGCYPAQEFKCAVLHEMGHTLGLGHPDQGTSRHSTTSPADWANAVMHSVIPASNPTTPQTDDIQAIQFYYGSFGSGSPSPTPTLAVTPTPTPTSSAPGPSRGHVTPLAFVTPKANVNGRQ
jgi:hypothetical protein